MDVTLVAVTALVAIAFVVLQFRSLTLWRGGWRIAALVPLIGFSFVVARVILDTQRDPTSHNLWPLEVLLAAVVALAASGLLYLGHRARERRFLR